MIESLKTTLIPNTKGGPSKRQEQGYLDRQETARLSFEEIAQLYVDGKISSETYRERMRKEILDYLTDIAILAEDEGYSFSEADLADLHSFVQDTYDLLDGMISHVSNRADFSSRYILWRASIFGFARQTFIRYTMPQELWDALPEQPGENCLGDGACGCSWEWVVMDNGEIHAKWVLGAKEHCVICLDFAVQYSDFVLFVNEK